MNNTSVKKQQSQGLGLGRTKFGANDKMRRMTQIGTVSNSGAVMFNQTSNSNLKGVAANLEVKTFKR